MKTKSLLSRGILVAIEGIDGSGKSTLAQNLLVALEQLGLPVTKTKEPGGTQLGKQLRQILQSSEVPLSAKAEYLLFAADRAHHMEQFIAPQLKQKKIIISDRLADSSLVYQGCGRGLGLESIDHVNRWAMQNVQPDIVFYLRITPDVAQQRIEMRNQTLTRFEKEQQDFIDRLYQGFETHVAARENTMCLDGLLSETDLAHTATEKLIAWIQEHQILV